MKIKEFKKIKFIHISIAIKKGGLTRKEECNEYNGVFDMT
jgi:hypothetical protein